jgi:hypothetical protein
VHALCYGLEPGDDEEPDGAVMLWFCDACKGGVPDPVCIACPNEGGAFKQLDEPGNWMHVVCALYTERCAFGDETTRFPVLLGNVAASSFGQKNCSLCRNVDDAGSGLTLGCDAGMCRTYFHPTCGQKHGLLQVDEEEGCELPYYAHCLDHVDKGKVRAARRAWATSAQRWRALGRTIQAKASLEVADAVATARVGYDRMRDNWATANEDSVIRTRFLLAELQDLQKKRLAAQAAAPPTVPELSLKFVEHYDSHVPRLNQLIATCVESLALRAQLEGRANELQQQAAVLGSSVEEARQRVHASAVVCQTLADTLGTLRGAAVPTGNALATGLGALNVVDPTMPRCHVCSSASELLGMVQCDSCRRHCHLDCHDPPLKTKPKKSRFKLWQCAYCDSSDEDEDDLQLAEQGAADADADADADANAGAGTVEVVADTAVGGRGKRSRKTPAKFAVEYDRTITGQTSRRKGPTGKRRVAKGRGKGVPPPSKAKSAEDRLQLRPDSSPLTSKAPTATPQQPLPHGVEKERDMKTADKVGGEPMRKKRPKGRRPTGSLKQRDAKKARGEKDSSHKPRKQIDGESAKPPNPRKSVHRQRLRINGATGANMLLNGIYDRGPEPHNGLPVYIRSAVDQPHFPCTMFYTTADKSWNLGDLSGNNVFAFVVTDTANPRVIRKPWQMSNGHLFEDVKLAITAV